MLARDEDEVAGEQEEGGPPGEPLEAQDRGVVADIDSSPSARGATVVPGKEGGGRTGGAGIGEEERFGLG